MALGVPWTDWGDARGVGGVPTISDTMVLPVSSNAVLFLMIAYMHKAAATTVAVTLTGETVATESAFDNLTGDSLNQNVGVFTVRNPGSGAKTLTLADDALIRAFAWVGVLVTGVPTSGFTDDIDHPAPLIVGNASTDTCSLTTTKPSGLLLTMFTFRGGTTGPFAVTPGGWVEIADSPTGSSTSTDFSHVSAYRSTTTAGAYTGTATATTSTGRPARIAVSVLASVNRRRQQVINL